MRDLRFCFSEILPLCKIKNMATIFLKGEPIHTSGELPAVGQKANDFLLINSDLTSRSLADYKGKRLILNIFPSIDTGTCAASVRQFNKLASELPNTVILCISRDLPFAMKRFCGAEGIENVLTLSDFATGEFGKTYGLEMTDGKLAHLHSRVVILLDENHNVRYTEQVSDIVNEPDYNAVLEVAKSL